MRRAGAHVLRHHQHQHHRRRAHYPLLQEGLGLRRAWGSTACTEHRPSRHGHDDDDDGGKTTSGTAGRGGRGWRVLFFGSDRISVATLSLLHRHLSIPRHPHADGDGDAGHHGALPSRDRQLRIDALHVVTTGGTGRWAVPVAQYAQRAGLPLDQPEKLRGWEMPHASDGLPFDIGVVVSYGHFIPPSVLDALPLGAINMHPSLLPRHRGAAPIYHTLLQGDSVTGVTVLEIHRKRFDAGRILQQVTVPVDPFIDYEELSQRLAVLGAEKVIETLTHYDEMVRQSRVQDESLATKAPKIDGTMTQVLWDCHPPHHIYNMWRALGGSVGVFTHFRGQRLKLMKVVPPFSAIAKGQNTSTPERGYRNFVSDLDAYTLHGVAPPQPGQVEYDRKADLLWVKCAVPKPQNVPLPSTDHEGTLLSLRQRELDGWVGVREVQMEGRRSMSASGFRNGFIAPARVAHQPPCFAVSSPPPASASAPSSPPLSRAKH